MVFGLSFGSTALGQEARWRALYNQTMELYQQGKYREAVPVAKEALKVAEQTFAPDHPNYTNSLNNLAELYRTQGQYAKAEPLHKRALAIWEKVLGPDHLYVALSLNNLGLLYYAQGQYAKAESLYRRALGIMENSVPINRNIAGILDNLAKLYIKMGRDDEAKKLLARASRIRAKQ